MVRFFQNPVNASCPFPSYGGVGSSRSGTGGDEIKVQSLYQKCLLQNCFSPISPSAPSLPLGQYYALDPQKGSGWYWVYNHKNLFAISMIDLVLSQDYLFESWHSYFLSLILYDSVSGKELNPARELQPQMLLGHANHNALYQAIFYKDIPIRGIGMTIFPAYYENYLKSKYPNEYESPLNAFHSLDQGIHSPELVLLFNQLKKFQGSKWALKLYYTGKVTEAISLILQHTKVDSVACPFILQEDREHLQRVCAHIDQHFSQELHVEHLSKIACMGTTKLKTLFKEVYQVTLFEYISQKRMQQAQNLLLFSEYSIQEISRDIGYKKSSSFAEAFRKTFGLLPSEFRKLSQPSSTSQTSFLL